MGIPAAFRWLSNKYPKIITPVIEEKPLKMEDGTIIPVDTTRPNPNGEEFDNLYLDMNGIVHPCSHPEDKPAPKDEEEMMLEIFKYTERVVNMVRPRNLLMIAVDGVAPRAKMNQQRSRRFRSAQEAKEKETDKEELLKLLKKQGGELSAGVEQGKAFDSNTITPGTPFMDVLAASLRYWCAYKLNTDPAWATIKVVISDATVPGEGEHKIMNFIRSQRASPDHNPNTRHVIYGLDADLIMLGLATHEPHFRVLREDVFAQDSRAKTCKLCGQKGHMAQACRGTANERTGEFDEKDGEAVLKPFIWLHVAVLREYLAVELDVPHLPFRFDHERAIDDWVFLCCFVGNDFLPHLPALEIRENGIDTLTAIWRDNLPHMGGYVTKDGHLDLKRAQVILDGLAKQENAIFRRRKDTEDRREASAKRRRLHTGPNGNINDQNSQQSLPQVFSPAVTYDMVMNRGDNLQRANMANRSAASVLKDQIRGGGALPQKLSTAEVSTNGSDVLEERSLQDTPASTLGKRKASLALDETTESASDNMKPPEEAGEDSVDAVRLWEDGYADRYYEQKFHVDPQDLSFRHQVARCYAEGLAWVLLYYFQGCPSWEWYYPYHYAPFAADFVETSKLEISFQKGRIAKPFEQLMSVLPAASRHALPKVFHDLMTREDSELIEFYPEEFKIDLNGKKMAWQGVALLPFIDMSRLLTAVEKRYSLLSPEDQARNSVGKDVLLISDANVGMYDDITTRFYSKKQGLPRYTLDSKANKGLAGHVSKISDYVPHGALTYPLDRKELPDIDYDRSLSVYYEMMSSAHHKSMLLLGVKLPNKILTHSDVEVLYGKKNGRAGSGRSYGGVPLSRSGNAWDREPINYGPDIRHGRVDSHRDIERMNGNVMRSYHGAPPAWGDPPPGLAHFNPAFLPPPPPAHLQSDNFANFYPQHQGGWSGSQSHAPRPRAHHEQPRRHEGYGRGGRTGRGGYDVGYNSGSDIRRGHHGGRR